MDVGASLHTYQVGARFKAFREGVLLVLLNPRYTQVGFNLISVQVSVSVSVRVHCHCFGTKLKIRIKI